MNFSVFRKVRGLMQLHRALRLVWQSARAWTAAGVLLLVVQAFLPLLTLYLIKLTVDAVAVGVSAPDKSVALWDVLFLIVLTGIVTLVAACCSALAETVREHQGQLVTDHVTDVIHGQSAAVDLAYYEDPRYHDTLYRTQQEAPFRPNRVVRSLTQLGQNSISLLGLAGLLFYLHWGIAAILFVAVVPGIVVRIRHADRLYDWQLRRTKTERRAFYFHRILTDSLHAKEMRLFNLGGLFRDWYRILREQLRREHFRLRMRRSTFELISQAGAILSLFGMFFYIVYRTLHGSMTLGDMVMYYQAFQRAQRHLQDIMGSLAGLYEDSLFLNHFCEFMDLKPQVAEPLHAVAVPRPMKTGIVLENVSFRYPSGKKAILQDIQLTIRPGEIVALVGDNGSGKTTLAKLLCRFYDPTAGRITMDGVDLRSFASLALRREITMIFQDYIHYQLTARENIWMGNTSLDRNDGRVQEAARKSGVEGVVSGLPKGYETVLGNWFDDGVELSIGEWQKVALSRAFVRDAQLIILDEPTSALSVRAEYEVFQAFRELLDGRSALLISHRFSTILMADMIYVLEDGKIMEGGTHEELIKLGGSYAHLFETQSQLYR